MPKVLTNVNLALLSCLKYLKKKKKKEVKAIFVILCFFITSVWKRKDVLQTFDPGNKVFCCHILNRKFDWVLNKETKTKFPQQKCKEGDIFVADSPSKLRKKLCKLHDSLSSSIKATSRWADPSQASISRPPSSSYGCRSCGICDLKSSLLTSFLCFLPPCRGSPGGTLWESFRAGKGCGLNLRAHPSGEDQEWEINPYFLGTMATLIQNIDIMRRIYGRHNYVVLITYNQLL